MSDNSSIQIERSKEVTFQFDGKELTGYDGETIAAALLRSGITNLRNAPQNGGARGMFCVMGVCQECVVKVDGKIKESCRTTVSEGLIVERVRYV